MQRMVWQTKLRHAWSRWWKYGIMNLTKED